MTQFISIYEQEITEEIKYRKLNMELEDHRSVSQLRKRSELIKYQR